MKPSLFGGTHHLVLSCEVVLWKHAVEKKEVELQSGMKWKYSNTYKSES